MMWLQSCISFRFKKNKKDDRDEDFTNYNSDEDDEGKIGVLTTVT